jgi:predicted NBD/HSP70 family sugar kinase
MVKNLIAAKDFKLSEKLIFRLVYQFGPVSKNEIVNYTNGAMSTVYKILAGMVQSEILLESKSGSAFTSQGRPAYIYSVNPNAIYAIGGYVTWESYGIGICSIDGKIIAMIENQVIKDESPKDVTAFFAESIENLIKQSGVDPGKIMGISVAAPGPLLKKEGILFHSHHLISPRWEVVPLKEMLEMMTDYETIIDNLVNTSLFGEIISSSANVHCKTAYFFFDRGIGSSTYSPGMAHLDFDSSSQLGHMVIDFKGKQCVCGKHGCLETYASSEAIAQRLSSIVRYKPGHDEVKRCEKQVWTCLPELIPFENNDSLRTDNDAKTIVAEISDAIVVAMVNYINIMRPEVVYLGGRTVQQMKTLFKDIGVKVNGAFNNKMLKKIEFNESFFNEELLIRGSAFNIFDKSLGLTNPVSV